ncbi:MAG TPA: ABC transporter ATP-binding protein [bacterium]|nr:ABC transporter ATP-binding protein [bacterium]
MAAELPALEVRGLRAGYGEVVVLRGVDLALQPGTITAVIGANGAGKSTLLRTIFGLLRATSGTIIFAGEDITHLGSHGRLGKGLVLVPQGRCNFPMMTVDENLQMGAFTRTDRGVRSDIERIYQEFELLAGRRRVLAGNLSGGEQQLLEMAMALMIKPKLILVDEPSLGLSPGMQQLVFGAITRLRDLGTTILMVEQNAVQALRIANRGIVIELGVVRHEGTGPSMLQNPEVRRAYLGLPA